MHFLRSHPEYYDTVINPIDPDKISTKVKGNNYQSVEEMAEDIKLLVSNTRSFFGADSQESCDVMAFEEAFKFAVQVQENASPSNAPSISSTASSSGELSVHDESILSNHPNAVFRFLFSPFR